MALNLSAVLEISWFVKLGQVHTDPDSLALAPVHTDPGLQTPRAGPYESGLHPGRGSF